ncbi:MAG TPA: histidine phosphatase family protein [Solirubrobacteraceae bacterium]|nr:histidine phosphatase family protein [Solirubrobacteraceae bacterium]
MARQIWLLRHAEAEPHGAREDAERRLTPRGEQQARAAGVALEQLGAGFDAVLYSPKVRARATAELAAEGWPAEERDLLAEHPPLASGFDASGALAALDAAPDRAGREGGRRVLLVGHEPDLSSVIAGLCGGNVGLKKGGLAIVRLDGARGELAAVLRPSEIALIAGAPVGRH